MLLKDHQNHLRAFIYAQDKAEGFNYGYFGTFHYLQKLFELEPKAVLTVPGHELSEDGLFYFFMFPVDAFEYAPEDLPRDVELVPESLYVDSRMVHDKQAAARFCGVTIRQLERWMKGDPATGKEPLRHVKMDRKPLFFEYDLWLFMRNHGCGERPKYVNEYIEGQVLPGFDIPKEGDTHG